MHRSHSVSSFVCRIATNALVSVGLVSFGLAGVAALASAQVHDPRALDADPAAAEEQIAPVLDGLGDAHIEITTSDPEAQRFFDQGCG